MPPVLHPPCLQNKSARTPGIRALSLGEDAPELPAQRLTRSPHYPTRHVPPNHLCPIQLCFQQSYEPGWGTEASRTSAVPSSPRQAFGSSDGQVHRVTLLLGVRRTARPFNFTT